eukprot:1157926-Pelagomonas_calceolata.AAC.1
MSQQTRQQQQQQQCKIGRGRSVVLGRMTLGCSWTCACWVWPPKQGGLLMLDLLCDVSWVGWFCWDLVNGTAANDVRQLGLAA